MTSINKLNIHNLRNIQDASLFFAPTFNFFYGNNGSGKTSVLEAIYLLATGKSFRSHLKGRIVSHQQRELTVFSELISPGEQIIKLGFSKAIDTNAKLKIDGEYSRSLAAAAKLLPVLLVDPASYGLLEKGPKERRQYLDWGLFHVEPSFHQVSTQFQRCLKQRNAALKTQSSKMICQTWDVELSNLAEQLTKLRINYFSQLKPYFEALITELNFNVSLQSNYIQGWEAGLPLQEALNKSWGKDSALGYTSIGPQKADILYSINNIPAEDILSRGQMKLVVSAMQFAQGTLYTALTAQTCIYLIDDLVSELDEENCRKLFILLERLLGQIFITATSQAVFSQLSISAALNMFHVKQGSIVPVDK